MLKRKKISSFDIINYAILTLMMFIFVYPMYYTLIASVSDPNELYSGAVVFWPKGFTLDGYKYMLETKRIWMGYRNSIMYTFFAVMLCLALTYPAAYALSKDYLFGKRIIGILFVFTMYFSGGLLPTYLIVKGLGLVNKWYTLIVLCGFSVHNTIVARTYFQSSIDNSLYEAAEMDGCSQLAQFFKIALPLAKPSIAVIALYYAVANWNGFMTGLVYVNNSNYYPLQLILRNILLENESLLGMLDLGELSASEVELAIIRVRMTEVMKYGIIFVSSLPMLLIYPIVQKHFVKGVMVGAVKG